MAISSVLRINALDVLGPICCKNRSVSSSNSEMSRLLRKTGFPSLLSMAQTDAVATIRQVKIVWPDFFTVSNNRRVATIPQRLGVKSIEVCNFAKEVVEAGLPTRLSNEVVQSDSLVGDVTRLAWQRVTTERNPKLYTCEWFEYILDTCLSILQSDGVPDYKNAFATYQKLCLDEFAALEIQDRRARFLDEHDRLVPDLKCRVAPPDWKKISRHKKKFFFGCSRQTVVTLDSGKRCDEPDFRGWCRVCGYWVVGNNYVVCRVCKKPSHRNCVEVLRIPKMSFKCSRITYFLGREGKLMKDPDQAPTVAPVRKRQQCLICGDSVTSASSWKCTLKCDFGAHVDCIRCLEAVEGKKFAVDQFRCNDVVYQMRPEQILRGVRLDVASVESLRSELKVNGRVNTAKYSIKTKRWVNEEVNCRKCHRWYGLNETDHHATYCTGVLGTPIPSRDTPYLLSRCKRFRHISWKTP